VYSPSKQTDQLKRFRAIHGTGVVSWLRLVLVRHFFGYPYRPIAQPHAILHNQDIQQRLAVIKQMRMSNSIVTKLMAISGVALFGR